MRRAFAYVVGVVAALAILTFVGSALAANDVPTHRNEPIILDGDPSPSSPSSPSPQSPTSEPEPGGETSIPPAKPEVIHPSPDDLDDDDDDDGRDDDTHEPPTRENEPEDNDRADERDD